MLLHLGLSAQAARTYEALLDHPYIGPAPHLRSAAMAPSEESAFEALEELVRVGFATTDRHGRYSAVPPDVAIPSLILRRSEQAELVVRTIPAMSERFWAGRAGGEQMEFIEIVQTREQIRDRWAQLDSLAQRSVRAFDRPPYVTDPLTVNDHEIASIARGVEYRIVYSRAAVEIPGRWPILEHEAAAGEKSRISPELPAKLTLFDDFAAIISLHGGDESTPAAVMIVHRSPLLDALQTLFEMIWRHATPLQGPAAPDHALGADGEHAAAGRLTQMLTTGMSDEAIRRHLDVSVSTLQRRLRLLFTELGARSRFQAGYLAALRDHEGLRLDDPFG